MSRHAAAALLALALACGGPAAERPELLPIPRPDLSEASPEVLEQIEGELAAVEALRAAEGTADQALADAYGQLGLLFVTYSFVEAAEVGFENARRLAPDDYRWLYLLGYLFEQQGRLDEARAVLERAVALEPANAPALIRLGRVRLEQGELDGARQAFERVLAVEPDAPAALEGLGRLAAAQGETDEAARRFERVLELQPTASSVRHALGLAYRRQGRLEEARRALEEGGDAPVLFHDPLLAATTRMGRSAEIYRVRGAQAFAEGRFDIAAGHYRRAVELEPEDFTTRKALGFSLQKLGDLDGAMEQLAAALEQGTTGEEARDRLERAEVHRILGGMMMLQGRESEGIESFRRVLELNPEAHGARLKLANALARRKDLEAAVTHYDRLVEALPEDPDLLVRRGTAKMNLDRRAEALADFRRAVEVAPEEPEVRLRYAEALEFVGRDAAAGAERAAARRLAGEGGDAARLAADAGARAMSRGDLQAAEAALAEALRLDPAMVGARYRLATILGHQGRYEEALAHFRRVTEQDPHHADAHYGQAAALVLSGDYAGAKQRLEAALQRMPAERRLSHLLARLMAAAPDPRVREGDRAVEMARRLYASGGGAAVAETLAMALAEAGRLDEAAAVQGQAIAAAGGSGDLQGMERRLTTYRSRRAWYASGPEEILEAAGRPAG